MNRSKTRSAASTLSEAMKSSIPFRSRSAAGTRTKPDIGSPLNASFPRWNSEFCAWPPDHQATPRPRLDRSPSGSPPQRLQAGLEHPVLLLEQPKPVTNDLAGRGILARGHLPLHVLLEFAPDRYVHRQPSRLKIGLMVSLMTKNVKYCHSLSWESINLPYVSRRGCDSAPTVSKPLADDLRAQRPPGPSRPRPGRGHGDRRS